MIKIAKETKENVLNQIKEIENNLKISKNTERNLRETRAIVAINKSPKYLYKFVKNNSTIRAGIGPLNDEEGNLNQATKNMSDLLNEQYNSLQHSGPKDHYSVSKGLLWTPTGKYTVIH